LDVEKEKKLKSNSPTLRQRDRQMTDNCRRSEKLLCAFRSAKANYKKKKICVSANVVKKKIG
jgi:hypothetical protein